MRRGPVSAAAMLARAVPEPRAFVSEHCSAEEYDAFLAGCDVGKHFVQQRRSHRKLFVQAWADLEAWLHAPLADRIGESTDRPAPRCGTSRPTGLGLISITWLSPGD